MKKDRKKLFSVPLKMYQAVFIKVLLNDPDQVSDTWLNFASAIWFYVTPQPPKPR